jgi:hypothetical protein
MASAYDEIKKALAMLRQGQPITDQSRAELNRVRKSLEQQLAAAELLRNDLPRSMLESREVVPSDSLAHQQRSAEL